MLAAVTPTAVLSSERRETQDGHESSRLDVRVASPTDMGSVEVVISITAVCG
jgi:hypothetical protein